MREPQAYMEMIYIDDDDNARQTDVRAQSATDPQTRKAFNSYRRLEVSRDAARFLLDYYDAAGDLADTILLDALGFEEITGKKAKADAEYRAIDAAYWAEALEARAKEPSDAG